MPEEKKNIYVDKKSPHWGLSPGPSVYRTDALPLSYRGTSDVLRFLLSLASFIAQCACCLEIGPRWQAIRLWLCVKDEMGTGKD